MTRLIDANALLEQVDKIGAKVMIWSYIRGLITNAPTVQREGWVSVPIEPTKKMQEAAIDNYMECPDCISWTGIYKAMIQAAPTDKE